MEDIARTDIIETEMSKFINKYKNKYIMYGISKEDILNILKTELEKDNNETDIEEYIDELQQNIIDEINLLARTYLTENKTHLHEYISKNIKIKKSGLKIKEELLKIVKYFDDINYQLDLDFVNELLTEFKIVSELLDLFVSRSKKVKKSETEEEIILDEELGSLLECYCYIKEIPIHEDEFDIEEIQKEILEDNKNEIEDNNFISTDLVLTYFREIRRLDKKNLTKEEEKERIIEIENCTDENKKQKLINDFLEHYLFLVVSIARRYIGSNIPFIDLIQQGNIGLIQAFSKFDPNKNTRFISYASVSIKNALSNFSATNRIVKVPKYFQKDAMRTYVDTKQKLEQEKFRSVTQEEIFENMNIKRDNFNLIINVLEDASSLNSAINSDDQSEDEVQDFVADKKQKIEPKVIDNVLHENLIEFLKNASLSEQQIDVLLSHNGFYGGEVYSFQAIADKYNVSRQRIGAIYNKTLDKLRNTRGIMSFANYLDDEETAKQFIKDYRKDNAKKNKNKQKDSK